MDAAAGLGAAWCRWMVWCEVVVVSFLGNPLICFYEPARDIHIGPSDYVPWQGDNKIAFIRMEGRGFGGAPIELELRLSVQDSPNSAGVVIDAIRCAKLALDRGIGGSLEEVSAYYMKTPPRQMRDAIARERCDAFIAGLTSGSTPLKRLAAE